MTTCDDDCGCTSAPAAATVQLTDKPTDDVPIACTLGSDEVESRLAEWGAVLRGVIARAPLDDGVRLELDPSTDVGEVARLAAAEQGCCQFFRFALMIDQRGTALEVHAPPDGQPVLTALFGAAI